MDSAIEQQMEPLALDVDLQMMVFEAAIVACEEQERDQVMRAIEVLQNFIDFENSPREVAMGVLSIYRECRKAAEAGRLDHVANWLGFLQELWAEALD